MRAISASIVILASTVLISVGLLSDHRDIRLFVMAFGLLFGLIVEIVSRNDGY